MQGASGAAGSSGVTCPVHFPQKASLHYSDPSFRCYHTYDCGRLRPCRRNRDASRTIQSSTVGASEDHKLVNCRPLAIPFCLLLSMCLCAHVVFKRTQKIREELAIRRQQQD